MGAYSDQALEHEYDLDPFAEDTEIPAFEEDDEMGLPSRPTVIKSEDDSLEEDEVPLPVTAPLPQEPDGGQSASPESIDEADKSDDTEDDEDAKRKAHEEAEAKRKAEWDAKQQEKKAAFQAKIDQLAAMSDDEVMVTSVKLVGAATEKITRRNMKDCVAEFIQTKCLEDSAFARKTMHPSKSMIHCFRYISRQAWEYVQDELKADGITPGPEAQGYGCDVPDDLCFQWAEDYFNDPDAKEDQVKEEEFVPRPYCGKSPGKSKQSKKGKAAKKKTPTPKKAEEKKELPKASDDLGQISFGDFTMPEEKAG